MACRLPWRIQARNSDKLARVSNALQVDSSGGRLVLEPPMQKAEPIFDFSFIRPNPNPTGIIELGVISRYEGAVAIEIVDALGRVIRRVDDQLLKDGQNTIKVAAQGISGMCYIRIHSPAGSIHSRPVLFVE